MEKNPEYDRFTALVDRVIAVPKSAVREESKAPRRKRKEKPTPQPTKEPK